MAQANQEDFLGEGTAAPVQAPGQLSQAELDALLLKKRQAIVQNSATNTANINNAPGGYVDQRRAADYSALDTSNQTVINDRLQRGVDPNVGDQSGFLKNLSRDPITMGILAAPYGVLGAGAALGGLAAGGAGTIAGGSAAGGLPAAITTGGAVETAALSAPIATAAAAPAAAAGSSLLPLGIAGGMAGLNAIGGLLKGDPKMPNMPASPAPGDRPEAALGGQTGMFGAGPAPQVQNTGNAAALNAAIMGAQQPQTAASVNAQGAPTRNQPSADTIARGQALGAQLTAAVQNGTMTSAQADAQMQAFRQSTQFQAPPVDAPAILPHSGPASPTLDASTGGQFAAGAGQGNINAVDQALTNFRPAPAAPAVGRMATAPGQVSMGALPGREAIAATPGGGSMGALPGVVGQKALPGNAQMGALPGQTDRSLQTAALDRVLGYDPNTSSKAEAQLADAQQMNLSNSLALARSARGGPAAQAQALRGAQAEGAATMSQSARDLATLRAQEEDTAKGRELSALGLGGQLTGDIRTGDIGERGQNVGAVEAALTAGVTQRGQTVGAITADQAARAQQRGQTVGAIETDRNAGVAERGQTIGAQSNALNAGVAQRGQDVGALETALNAGVTQRGQDVNTNIAERNAGVTERGQTTTANTAANQQQLDAILGRGTLAGVDRNAGVTERGQNINAAVQMEGISQARDAVATSAATDAQKTAATLAIEQARLGYELTPEQKMAVATVAAMSNQPSAYDTVLKAVQGGVDTYLGLKRAGA